MEKLYKLLALRAKEGSDKEGIDKTIWETYGHNCSIVFTDLSGFTATTEKHGIIHFLQLIYQFKTVFEPVVERENGTVIKVEGDSYIVIFDSPEAAVKACVSAQRGLKNYNESKEQHEKVHACMGIGYGLILNIHNEDVYGSEVNLASKLGEDIACKGEILITKSVANSLEGDKYIIREVENELIPGIKYYRLEYDLA